MTLLVWLGLGLGIGLASGLLGIGGGVFLIPLLMWLAHFDQSRAAGVTLAVLAVPVALPAVLEYYRNGAIGPKELWIALWIAIGFAMGGYAGASVQPLIPMTVLRLLFGLLLLYVAVRFLVATDNEVLNAAIGVGAVALAALTYWRLKLLGHKNAVKPTLEIGRVQATEPADGYYHI